VGPQIECANANAKMQIKMGSHSVSILRRYAQMTNINCMRFISWNLSEGEAVVAKVDKLIKNCQSKFASQKTGIHGIFNL